MNPLAILILSSCAVFPRGDVCKSSVAPDYYTPQQCEALVPVISAGFVNGVGENGGAVFWLDVHCETVKGDGG